MAKTYNGKNVRAMCYVALAAALLSICAWIAIPMTVPITLQTFAVFAISGLLGMKRSLAAVSLYILLGVVGLPVFSGGGAGAGALLGATGGYIVGFLPMAVCSGFASDRWGAGTAPFICLSLLGLLLCYALGTAWFMYVYARSTGEVGLLTALGWCVFPYALPDVLKLALAAIIVPRLKKSIK